MTRYWITALLCTLIVVDAVNACPFCSAVGQTFAQEIEALDAAVLVRSVELKEMPGPEEEGALPLSKFKVIKILKGEQWTNVGDEIETHYFGESKEGLFLIFGADAPDILWTSPLRMSERSVKYLESLMDLPPKGPDRLKFFQAYLEDEDEMLSSDAYDEFARAPYEEIIQLKPFMNRAEILGWIQDSERVPAARRRLYLTMLGVCGEKEDAKLLEKFMRSENLEDKLGLDAMVACYLTLEGEAGMKLVKELFLSNPDAEYSHTYSAIMAIRFHAAETEVLSREIALDGLRCILDREDLADLVIPDLARMEDWDSLPRLVELFRTAQPGESWARVPVINFVRACPLPAADEALKKLKEIDPAAVKRASTFFPFAPKGSKPRTTSEAAEETEETEDSSNDATTESKTSRNDVPQEVQYARTVSAEIDLPSVEDFVGFPSASEYAALVEADPVADRRQSRHGAARSPFLLPLFTLGGVGVILLGFVWLRRIEN